MKRVFIAVAALAMVATASAAEAARKPELCQVRGSRTLDAGVAGRVYLKPTRDPDRILYCAYRTGRRVAIGWDDCFNAPGLEQLRFSRRFLAVGTVECTPGGSVGTIDVRRARDGRRLRTLPLAAGVRRRSDGSTPTVDELTDLVLRPDGAVAWIVVVTNPAGGERVVQVRSSRRGHGSIVLASRLEIEPGSLALAGSRLYWTEGGEPRSAELR